MNARILELKKVVATIQRTVVSMAREPFDVNDHEVRIGYLASRGSATAYVDGEKISGIVRGYGSALIADDICRACGVTDSGVLYDITLRVELAMGQ